MNQHVPYLSLDISEGLNMVLSVLYTHHVSIEFLSASVGKHKVPSARAHTFPASPWKTAVVAGVSQCVGDEYWNSPST